MKCDCCSQNEAQISITTYKGKTINICLSSKTDCSDKLLLTIEADDRIRSYTTVNHNVQIESTRTGQIGSKFHGEGEGKAGSRTKDNPSGSGNAKPAVVKSVEARIASKAPKPPRLRPRDVSQYPRVGR